MTFDEFVAARREVEDVSVAERHGVDRPDTPDAGIVYPTGLFISRVGAHWPEEARVAGAWHLLISNQEWIDDDLSRLERILWESFDYDLVDEPAPTA